MRRLDVRPLKKLRGRARYERAFRRDMARIAGDFPPRDAWQDDYFNWKLPVYEKAVSVAHGTAAFRRDVVAALVGTAAQIAQAKPSEAGHARVAAIIEWPHLFGSEICVFFDRDYEARFDPERDQTHSRYVYDDNWIESRKPTRDLLAQLEIDIPAGFGHAGTAFEDYQAEDDHIYTYEHWVVMEHSARVLS